MSSNKIESSPLKLISKLFNIKNDVNSNVLNKTDISLLTEISDRKVILEFNWIQDLDLLVSSFIIDDFDENILHQQINKINDNLIIGHLKQNNNKAILYKHTLPLVHKNEHSYLKKYLEDLLSEFNHLITVLLKKFDSNQKISLEVTDKIIGHA